MTECKGTFVQYVPRGYGYKEVMLPCGSITIHGTVGYCNRCEERISEQYPQGWRNFPGDTCKHGNYIGDSYGIDYMCPLCEDDQ